FSGADEWIHTDDCPIAADLAQVHAARERAWLIEMIIHCTKGMPPAERARLAAEITEALTSGADPCCPGG
ncbi:MAG TPA: hypothetical protein VN961_18120, partial [Streptosporangiaceae bacterium]|nr:hypothetical protein [Streptosporangiaceae bacterium]